jgi:hypothetical protein
VFGLFLFPATSQLLAYTDGMTATKADVEAHFASHGTGKITEIKLMNGFGFIEYEDAMDARDVVPGKEVHPEWCFCCKTDQQKTAFR